MDIGAAVPYVVGVVFMLAPSYFWWERWRTRGWPTTKARVIEISPQSIFEDGVDTYHLNLDSGYAIEYTVRGRKYLQTPDIESNVRIGGFKIWRAPSIPKEFRIRYDERDPSRYSFMHVLSPVLLTVVSMACVLIGLFIIGEVA